MLKCPRRGLAGVGDGALPHFFEGPAVGMVRDLPKTNTQSTLNLEILQPRKIPFQREFALTHTHPAASGLPTSGECPSRTRARCLKMVNPGLRKSQHPGSCPRPWRSTSRTVAQAEAWSRHSWGWVVGISWPFHSCSNCLTTWDPPGPRPQGS